MPPLHNTDFETQENTEMTTPSSEYTGVRQPNPARSRIPAGLWIACLVVLAVVVVGIVYRLIQRTAAESSLKQSTLANATSSVNVIHPVPATGGGAPPAATPEQVPNS